MNKDVRVRFAPSPTGHLHIGSLRTALFNWLFARHNKGVFLMRIEDTDLERSKEEYTKSIQDALRWFDIQPNEEIVIQSERRAAHLQVIKKLLEENKAYRCYCTQEEIKERAGDSAFIKYDGTCREKTTVRENVPYVVRFKLPDIKDIVFDDLIRGRVVFERDQLDDFIIVRSDGSPMYNFVVVVDDEHMGITQIIRGEDHISNTPKQILLYQACGYSVPQFAHLPLILGPSGDRLSKRDAATSVMKYKQEGYLPDALINYLVRLGWAHGDQEIFNRDELIQYFTLEAVGKKGAIFDIQKLQWVNGVYIRNMSSSDLISYISNEVDSNFRSQFSDWNDEQLAHAIDLYKERISTLRSLIDELSVLYEGPTEYVQEDIVKWIAPETKKHLEHVITLLQDGKDLSELKTLAKELGIKVVHLMQPMRIALIGKGTGPGVGGLLAVIGKERSSKRIHALLSRVK